jgi:uncharacterized protein
MPLVTLEPDGRAALHDGPAPRIHSLLVKPASALCNLGCEYCFYLDREADPYEHATERVMSLDTLERVVDGYLFYSYPASAFGFQGGEPTLAGLRFYERLVELQKRCGRPGQSVSNSIQTNGLLLDQAWCELLREYHFLVGLSLDGPEDVHDRYRVNRARRGSWAQVMRAAELLRRERVEYNVLCVVSAANVERAGETYRFFRKLGVQHMQFIPLAEFGPGGAPLPYTISGAAYGRFLCEIFDLWWPERRRVRVRFFDNLAEALAGQKPGGCTFHASCDSYAVVEYNGDVYPCDFFVETRWKLGNIEIDSWPELARRRHRYEFAALKSVPHAACQACEHLQICHGGCPKDRHRRFGRFEDLDWFCEAYQLAFGKARAPLERDVRRLMARPERGG